MKTTVADYRYKIYCLRIVPLWGSPVYLTDHPKDIVIGSDIYKTDSGYSFSGLSSESNMSPGMLDLDGISTIAGVSKDKIRSGVFDNARVYAFATTWNNPIADEEPLGVGIAGKTTVKDDKYTIQLMLLGDVLGQSVGKTYTAACPKTFGGQEFAGCKYVITPVTGTITSVTNNYIFHDSSRVEVSDYFGLGTISFTSGNNVGLKPLEIKNYNVNGTITTYEPFYYSVQVGDSYSMIPGCRKRLTDCSTKFNNVINFGGFSFIPTQSTYQIIGGL